MTAEGHSFAQDRARVLNLAIGGFGVLGREEQLAHGEILLFTVADWVAPSFSPVICLAPMPSKAHLDLVRTVWHRSDRLGTRPSLLIPATGGPPPTLEGWALDDRPLLVIVEPCDVEAPSEPRQGSPDESPEFDLRVRNATDRAARDDFLSVVASSFPSEARDHERLLRPLQQDGVVTDFTFVSAKNTSSGPIATSALSVRGRLAFQTWGSVAPQFRGLRVSRILQQGNLRRARQLGAQAAITVTRNPRVAGTHRPHVDLWIYRFRSSPS